MNVAILGAGNWGTTLAILLSKKVSKIFLWSIEEPDKIERTRENKKYLPGFKIPENVKVTGDLSETLSSSEIVIFAVPSHAMREVAQKVSKMKKNLIAVSVAKGIELHTFKRMTQILEEELNTDKVCALSGPTIAREVVRGLPTACVCASKNKYIGEKIQKLFYTDTFRVYYSDDVIGVELGGALKNVIVLAAGMCDGLNLGVNAKSALLTRGLYEMQKLGVKMGAKPLTFAGLSGMGDLITTAFSQYSRNRYVGEQLGKGRKLKDILSEMVMVAEGVKTTKAVYELSQKYKIEMPITKVVYEILYENLPPKEGIKKLMERPLKSELG